MIKLIQLISELGINYPNVPLEKVVKYYKDNIMYNDFEFDGNNPGWSEYKEICKPYCIKYGIVNPIFSQEFERLSQSDLNSFYKEMRKLVQKHVGTEILNESLNNYIVELDDIEDVLTKQFPDKKLEIIEYIESINIEPDNYQNLTYNHLIDDFTNFIESNNLNELSINNPYSNNKENFIKYVNNYFNTINTLLPIIKDRYKTKQFIGLSDIIIKHFDKLNPYNNIFGDYNSFKDWIRGIDNEDLPLNSSGSFITALLDKDWVYNMADQYDMDEDEIDNIFN